MWNINILISSKDWISSFFPSKSYLLLIFSHSHRPMYFSLQIHIIFAFWKNNLLSCFMNQFWNIKKWNIHMTFFILSNYLINMKWIFCCSFTFICYEWEGWISWHDTLINAQFQVQRHFSNHSQSTVLPTQNLPPPQTEGFPTSWSGKDSYIALS